MSTSRKTSTTSLKSTSNNNSNNLVGAILPSTTTAATTIPVIPTVPTIPPVLKKKVTANNSNSHSSSSSSASPSSSSSPSSSTPITAAAAAADVAPPKSIAFNNSNSNSNSQPVQKSSATSNATTTTTAKKKQDKKSSHATNNTQTAPALASTPTLLNDATTTTTPSTTTSTSSTKSDHEFIAPLSKKSHSKPVLKLNIPNSPSSPATSSSSSSSSSSSTTTATATATQQSSTPSTANANANVNAATTAASATPSSPSHASKRSTSPVRRPAIANGRKNHSRRNRPTQLAKLESLSYTRLLDNNKKWATDMVAKDPNYFSRLATGQSPPYLLIGCSDSRVPPDQLTQTKPGEIFIHRNVANLVVNTDMNLMAVLQYAVEVLKVQHIIVMGHTECGGVRASMTNEPHGLIDKWLRNIKDVYRLHRTELDGIADMQLRFNRLVELNIIEQVYNLYKTSTVQKAWASGHHVQVHGWICDIHDGLIRDLNVEQRAEWEDIEHIYEFHFDNDNVVKTPGVSEEEKAHPLRSMRRTISFSEPDRKSTSSASGTPLQSRVSKMESISSEKDPEPSTPTTTTTAATKNKGKGIQTNVNEYNKCCDDNE